MSKIKDCVVIPSLGGISLDANFIVLPRTISFVWTLKMYISNLRFTIILLKFSVMHRQNFVQIDKNLT